jgi:hypothetical protein
MRFEITFKWKMLQNVINILKFLEEELKSHELHKTID